MPHKAEARCLSGVQGGERQQGGGRAALPTKEGAAGPRGGFLNGTCERDLRSGVNWMVTVGREERRPPNLLAFPMDIVVLTPVLIWDVLYGSGVENFGWTMSRGTAESEQRITRRV